MEQIGLTTAAGISAAVVIVIESLKKLTEGIFDKQHSWYGSLVNLCTLITSLSLGGIAYLSGISPHPEWLLNAILAFFLSIGGYEPAVNLFRAIFHKK